MKEVRKEGRKEIIRVRKEGRVRNEGRKEENKSKEGRKE